MFPWARVYDPTHFHFTLHETIFTTDFFLDLELWWLATLQSFDLQEHTEPLLEWQYGKDRSCFLKGVWFHSVFLLRGQFDLLSNVKNSLCKKRSRPQCISWRTECCYTVVAAASQLGRKALALGGNPHVNVPTSTGIWPNTFPFHFTRDYLHHWPPDRPWRSPPACSLPTFCGLFMSRRSKLPYPWH